jgi:hypothetical protein
MIEKFKEWFLSKDQKVFILETNKSKKSNTSFFSLIQCSQDLNYLKHFHKYIENDKETNFDGILPKNLYGNFINRILILPFFLRKSNFFLIRIKWRRLYSKAGVNNFFYPGSISLYLKFKNLFKGVHYFFKIKSKKTLLIHRYKDIMCGDLIYDSYLRYQQKPTINIADPTLIIFLYECYNQVDFYEKLAKEHSIQKYISSYATYIHHGIPIRVFLKHGIRVYTLSTITANKLQYKELNISDTTHVKPHWNYNIIFKGLKEQEKLIENGLQCFNKRFAGINDLSYMKVNQYNHLNDEKGFTRRFDGVVFLHDFFDSPHVYRSLIFEDFYEWILHTIHLTLNNKLNIGFKPHPNQLPESKKVINKLKLRFPMIEWIEEETSNKTIFESGIDYGISAYGTVLTELAFHQIKPICCGDNPASDYNFIFEATTKNEYDSFILNHIKLKLRLDVCDQLGQYYYMNFLHQFYNDINTEFIQ